MGTFTIDLLSGEQFLFNGNFNGSGSTTAGLQQVTQINAKTNIESTFNGGLVVNKIRPTGDTKSAIQINSANGTTHIINIDTVSGFTGYGTTEPKNKIHLFGTDTSDTAEFSVQSNGLTLDGVAGADKEIVWANNGVPKWQAQTFRNENDAFWYLTNTQAQNNLFTVMETGRIGINKQSNYINYHAAEIVSVTGLDDLIISGIYTQNYNTVYEIEIVSSGVTFDTWHWRKSIDAGITYNSYSPISGTTLTPVLLEYGISVSFENLTGHGAGAKWRFAGFSQIPQATLTLAPMGIQEVQKTDDYTASPISYSDITALANGGVYENHFEVFSVGTGGTIQALYFGFTVQAQMIFVNLSTYGAGISLVTQYWNTVTSSWTPLSYDTHNYIDGTDNLTKSGRIIWQPTTMTGWNKGFIPNLAEVGYELYWIRIETTTNPNIAPIAKNISIGNDKRFSIYNSFNDYRPSYYIDSTGRVNIGGGNITGGNKLQVNSENNVQVTSTGTDSLVEFDSENSAVVDLKIKLSSNDTVPPGITFVKTRGTLNDSTCTQTNDLLGAIKFRGRAGTSGRLLAEIGSQFVGAGTTRCGDIYFNTAGGSDPIERVRIDYTGNTGFGVTPSAIVTLKAGTTTNAPLKFNNGSLLSSPQAGAMEYDGVATYITTTGLTRQTFAYLNSPIFTGAPSMPSGTTFAQGLATCLIRPLADSTTALKITKTNGITPIVNFDTISGFTGYGTIAPKALIHTYGVDNACDHYWNYQTNGIRVDGAYDTDKDVQWFTEGKPAFTAQIFRCENGRYWYLSSPQNKLNQLTVSDSGRIGVNNQNNIMDKHGVLMVGSPNDIIVGGYYTENYTSIFDVEINSVSGLTDTFKWRTSTDDGQTYSSWSLSSGCTTGATLLMYGVTIAFGHVTGHTLGTEWRIPAFSSQPIGTFVITPNKFDEVQITRDYNAIPIVFEDVTGKANGSNLGIPITMFNTGVTDNSVYFGTVGKSNDIFFNLSEIGEGIILVSEYWDGLNWVNFKTASPIYIDNTLNLTQSGQISWDIGPLNDWTANSINGVTLYWMRLRTSTNPTKSPVANSFARNGANRLSVMSAPSDYIPSFYVDSLGRTNIGGGNITGKNKFQINSERNINPVLSTDVTLFEIDSDNICASGMKSKISSNDAFGSTIMLVKTRGTLAVGANMMSGDTLGNIEFRGRVGGAGGYITNISSQYLGNGTTRCGDLIFSVNNGTLVPSETVRMKYDGTTGFGVTPSAIVTLKAGSSNIAPLKFNSGNLLSSPQAGAVEFNNDAYYGTITSGDARKTFAFLESPIFTGNPQLPIGTCLIPVSANLNDYIWNSGGTNNACLFKTCSFNAYTGNTQPTINIAITGASNGLTKSGSHDVKFGGLLIEDTTVGAGGKNFTLCAKKFTIASHSGTDIYDALGNDINIFSSGGTVTLYGKTSGGTEAMSFIINQSQATFTDSRVTPKGIEYNENYAGTFVARSLVDKGYVDSVATGLVVKTSVQVATTANISLSGLTTVDSVILTNGTRVLVKDQNTGSQNGIYVATGSTWHRAVDYDFSPAGEIGNGNLIPVVTGTTNGNTIWVLTTPDPIVSGDTLTFSLFSKTSAVVAGNGINVTQTAGNYDVSVKLANNCGLCSDSSGLRVNQNIAGTGLNYTTGVLSVCGSNLAGNSILWSGNTFNVNPSTGTLNTVLNTKLDTSVYQSYTGTTATAISCRLLTTTFQTYTGTTVPNTYVTKSTLTTYTGTTAPAQFIAHPLFDSYTGATKIILDNKAFLSGATFSGVLRSPKASQNDNSTCVATTSWYISQGATATPLMDDVATCGTSNLFARQDHVHPHDTSRLEVTVFNVYTGTTAPAQFVNHGTFDVYTGTTVPNTYVTKSVLTTYTGTTAPNTYVTKLAYNNYTGATKIVIDSKAYLSGATFSGILRSPKPAQNDNSTCVTTTSWYISQGGTAAPLMDDVAACGISNLFARQDHVHPHDTSRLEVSIFNGYTGTTAPNTYATINTGIVTLTGATLLNATYAGKTVEANGTFTITFPNSMAIGMQVDIVNVGAGVITLAASTTLQSKSSRTKLASQYIGASVYHRGSNIWLAVGDLTP